MVCAINEKKISLIERNQDFKGQSIYHELRNYAKIYFSFSHFYIQGHIKAQFDSD